MARGSSPKAALMLVKGFVFVTAMTWCTVADSFSEPTELRGHMQPLGQHRPGPEDTIDEYNGSLALSSETFFNEYVSKRRPVVIRGAALDMPAFSLWTDEYLDSKFGDLEIRLEEKVEGESNDRLPAGKFGIGRDTLGNFLSGYKEPESNAYSVGDLPDAMYKDVNIIPCVACSSLYNKIHEVNFWMTSQGAASAIHRDALDTINCLLSGRKEWFFMDSHYNDEVYVVHRTKYELGGLSLVNPRAVDLEQFPKFAEVKYAFLTVNPGDCLYIPSGYYHQVKSPGGRNVAVSVLWSKTPRNVQVNTCRPGDERAKALAETDVYFPYPGTGDMMMASMDIEIFRSLLDNFTLDNNGRCDHTVFAKVLAEMASPAEGYIPREIVSENDPETQENALKMFEILNSAKKKPWLTVADMEQIPLKTWQDVVAVTHVVDASGAYDFEYTVIAAEDIREAVDTFFRRRSRITRRDWLQLYTQVFDELNPEGHNDVKEEDFMQRLSRVLEKFEAADPRLDVDDEEVDLITRRAARVGEEDTANVREEL